MLMNGLEDKVFYFRKQKHAVEFMNNLELVANFIAVNYKHHGTKMAMVIKKMYKTKLHMQDISEDTSRRVDIFIWENKNK